MGRARCSASSSTTCSSTASTCSLTGFDDDELDRLLRGQDATGARDDEDDIPETPEHPVTPPGDLWMLGPHRLLCGDATVATDVARLLDGVTPQLMVSDPPYGVDYDPAWRNKAGAAATRRTGKVLNDDRADWREAWALFPGDIAYVWHGALHAATVAESLEVAGFAIRSQIIWAKERLVLSRGDYHWQHEPCWYAVRKTGKGHWAGDRKQTTLWTHLRAATRTPPPSTAPRSRSSACAARSSTTRARARRSTSRSWARAPR